MYLKWLLLYEHLSVPLVMMGKFNLDHKIQKWGCSDLILEMLWSIHWRCPQIWYGILRTSGLKTTCLFRWKPIDFYWKFLLFLWPWQRSNWSCWCILGGSSIDVSTLLIKIFETQWQFMPPSKLPNVKTFYDHGDLKTRSRSNLWHSIKGFVIKHLRYKYQVSISNGCWLMDICLSLS